MGQEEPADLGMSVQSSDPGLARNRSLLAFAGIGFIYGSILVFGLTCYVLNRHEEIFNAQFSSSISYYLPELIMAGIGAFGALLGVGLLRSIGLTRTQPSRVVNSVEWDAICDQVKLGQEEAVTQYIRLTSLSGFTGTFTKLGLTGLPLATIALTIFFSLISIGYPAFMDLAKLTLGAFIGSFVQKQVGQSGSVKLPTGERVKVSGGGFSE